jgi:hypothetical protein
MRREKLPPVVLMDIKGIKGINENLKSRNVGLDVSSADVTFENPVKVYPFDPANEQDSRFDGEDVEIGTATVYRNGDKIMGDIELLPYLESFYSQHPRFRPIYTAVGRLVAEGNRAIGISIEWIKATCP